MTTTTPALERCAHGGRLVPMGHWLPRAPFDFDHGLGRLVVGCNQLRCTRCDEMVRWLDGVEVPAGQRRTPDELAGVVDPIAAGLLVPSAVGRLYVCACAIRVAFTIIDVDDGYGLDPRVSEPGPWRCGGHPLVTLPERFDGIALTPTTDLDALVAGYVAGELPRRQPFGATVAAQVGGAWLLRLYGAVAMPAFRDALSAAIARHAAAHPDDAGAVALAADFFEAIPLATGAEVVVALAEASEAAEAAGDRGDDRGDGDDNAVSDALAEALWLIATVRDDDVGARALERCRVALLAGRGVSGYVHALAERDPAWLVDHAAALAAAAPTDWLAVPYALRASLEPQAFASLAAACAAAAGVDGTTFTRRLGPMIDPELLDAVAGSLAAAS